MANYISCSNCDYKHAKSGSNCPNCGEFVTETTNEEIINQKEKGESFDKLPEEAIVSKSKSNLIAKIFVGIYFVLLLVSKKKINPNILRDMLDTLEKIDKDSATELTNCEDVGEIVQRWSDEARAFIPTEKKGDDFTELLKLLAIQKIDDDIKKEIFFKLFILACFAEPKNNALTDLLMENSDSLVPREEASRLMLLANFHGDYPEDKFDNLTVPLNLLILMTYHHLYLLSNGKNTILKVPLQEDAYTFMSKNVQEIIETNSKEIFNIESSVFEKRSLIDYSLIFSNQSKGRNYGFMLFQSLKRLEQLATDKQKKQLLESFTSLLTLNKTEDSLDEHDKYLLEKLSQLLNIKIKKQKEEKQTKKVSDSKKDKSNPLSKKKIEENIKVTEDNISPKQNKKGVFIIIAVAVVIVSIGGFYLWNQMQTQKQYKENLIQQTPLIEQQYETIDEATINEQDEYAAAEDADMIAAEEENNYTINSIIGVYSGKFGKNQLNLSIEEVNTQNKEVKGWGEVKGTKRSLLGSYDELDGVYSFTLNEPGDEEWDGVFECTIATQDINELDGKWTANNGELERVFVLIKN